MNLRKKLQLSQVKRWPICSMMREQSVAEHSFNVMLIAQELVSAVDDGDLYMEVLAYALAHDMDEVETGDIPSPFKRRLRRECPAVVATLDGEPKASDTVRGIVKLADFLEAIYWLREFGGSRTATEEIYRDILNNFNTCVSLSERDGFLPLEVLEKAKWLCSSL